MMVDLKNYVKDGAQDTVCIACTHYYYIAFNSGVVGFIVATEWTTDSMNSVIEKKYLV